MITGSTRGQPADTVRDSELLGDIISRTESGSMPLVAVAGPVGAGHAELFALLRAALDARGIRAVTVRCSQHLMGTSLSARLASIDRHTTPTSPADAMGWTKSGLLAGSHQSVPAQTAAAIAGSLCRADIRVLLIEDAHWLDQHSLAVLSALARTPDSGVICVCAAESPGSSAARTALRALWRDGLARVLSLRPLGRADIATTARKVLQAQLEPEVIAQLRLLTGGLPAALPIAIAELARGDGVAIAAGRAHLVAPVRAVLPQDHPLLAAIKRLGADAWPIVKAVVALHPLGSTLPVLVATALGTSQTAVAEVIRRLCLSGVLRRTRHGWRFRSEMVAATIAAQLGPYERRHLARAAVTAVWDGAANHVEPTYYGDRLSEAGKLVDRERACAELVACAEATGEPDSERWLLAAATVTANDFRRPVLLAKHARACYRHKAYERSLRSAEWVLREHSACLPAGEVDALTHIMVLARHAVGDTDSPDHYSALPPDVARETVNRATDLLLRGQTNQARMLLETTESAWQSRAMTSYLGNLALAQAHLLLGNRARFDHRLDLAAAGPPSTTDGCHWDVPHLRLLPALLSSDADIAKKIIAAVDLPAESWTPAHRAALALSRGEFGVGEDLARRGAALGRGGYDIANTLVQQRIAVLGLARGQLSATRDLLHAARAADMALPHLLDGAEALINRALGDHLGARDRLRHGLSHATDRDIVLETDQLWAQLAEIEFRLGDTAEAVRCCAEARRIAAAGDSSGALLRSMVPLAIVERDAKVADAAASLAYERGQPLEFATTIGRLCARGLVDPRLLVHAYELLGDIDALLYRAWLRNLMRDNGVSVPGRQQTLVENERLLAVLAADGLSNKQLATVLQATEKSVEGRLSRLFTRSGYQSRVELATAVHTGEYLV